MKKLLLSILALMILSSSCFATTYDWKRGTNADVLAAGENPGINYTQLKQYSTDPLDRLLNHYVYGCTLSYTSATTVTISAGEVTTQNSGNTVHIFRQNTSTTTVDLTVSGVGGLDTGTVAASTWYYIYADADASANTFTAIASLSDSAPTGVTNYRYIGSILTDSSSHVLNFHQSLNYFQWDVPIAITTTPSTNDTFSSATSCSAGMPATSMLADFACFVSENSGANYGNVGIYIIANGDTTFNASSGTGNKHRGIVVGNSGIFDNSAYFISGIIKSFTDSSQQINHMESSSPNQIGVVTIAIKGYYINR